MFRQNRQTAPTDWAWPADTDNISAAPTPAALKSLSKHAGTERFHIQFPIQIDVPMQDTPRRIESLVSPQLC
jgi:hypothetical protein